MKKRKMMLAMKRQTHRWRCIVVRVPWMERQNQNVRIQTNKQMMEMVRPTRVIHTNSNVS